MRIYLDKEGLTNRKREYPNSYDANYNIQPMYRAVFSDGSSCSCYFGAIGESQVNEDDESKCEAIYGMGLVKDRGRMSDEAWDFANQWIEENAKTIEVPSVKEEDSEWTEPDYEKLDELGEAFTDELYESMTELTEQNELTYAC
jgi:hypothetical protein